MPTARVPGAELYYERAGDGRPLLHIQGTGSDLRRPPSPFDWPAAARFDQLAYDHRGLGRSRASDPQTQPSMADFAADALALADAVGWRSFALIGVSFGGMVAQEVAIRAPQRVERLALCCTSSGGAGGSSGPLHKILALAPAERTAAMVALLDRRTGADAELRAAITATVQARPDEDERLRAASERQLEARRQHDTWRRLGAITAPTLVAAGRHDGLAPLENSIALAGAIAGARLEVFEGGHAFLQQDERAWAAIAGFLVGA